MDFFLDDPETEQKYQEILHRIKQRRNGLVAESMVLKGINYKINWGVPVVILKELASEFSPGHMLAMKLWNKKWRESMIMATMLDVPAEVTGEQMDYWTKSFENIEIAEQAVANLWVKTPFAFIKALEWCRGKKHLVKATGILLIGRLAMTDKKSTVDMFDIFFDELKILAKDARLHEIIIRSSLLVDRRSPELHQQVTQFASDLMNSDSESAKNLGIELTQSISI